MAASLIGAGSNANHDSKIYGITIAFMLLAIVVVVLRFYTVIRLRRQKPMLDDLMIAVSLVSANEAESLCVLAQIHR